MTVPQTLSSTTSRRDARIKFEISPILPTDLCPANPTQIIVQSVIPVLCCHREESHKAREKYAAFEFYRSGVNGSSLRRIDLFRILEYFFYEDYFLSDITC